MWKFHLENVALVAVGFAALVAFGFAMDRLDRWLSCHVWGC